MKLFVYGDRIRAPATQLKGTLQCISHIIVYVLDPFAVKGDALVATVPFRRERIGLRWRDYPLDVKRHIAPDIDVIWSRRPIRKVPIASCHEHRLVDVDDDGCLSLQQANQSATSTVTCSFAEKWEPVAHLRSTLDNKFDCFWTHKDARPFNVGTNVKQYIVLSASNSLKERIVSTNAGLKVFRF